VTVTIPAAHELEVISRVLAWGTDAELLSPPASRRALAALVGALARDGLDATAEGPDTVVVRGRRADPETVGRVVAAAGVVVFELRTLDADLEDAFFDLTTTPHEEESIR
jgi:hypothetical protein